MCAKVKATEYPHEKPTKAIRKELAHFSEENEVTAVNISRIPRN